MVKLASFPGKIMVMIIMMMMMMIRSIHNSHRRTRPPTQIAFELTILLSTKVLTAATARKHTDTSLLD